MHSEQPHFRHIHLLDTAVGTFNIGDEIISESARLHLAPILDTAYVTVSSAHDGLGYRSLQSAKQADVIFLLGANKLSNRLVGSTRSVFITPRHVPALAGKVVLVGVGAESYVDQVTRTQRALLRRILSRRFVHSVRDERALNMLKQIGLSGVNTSCPTLWEYTDAQPEVRPERATTVCFSLTSFAKDPVADRQMIQILREQYERLIFWPQMFADLAYLHELVSPDGIEILTPNLTAYDTMLAAHRPDIVGTRLHGTIRGLSFGCRVLVVAIDNRASDISAETGLPSIARASVATGLGDLVGELPRPTLRIPGPEIGAFLAQFSSAEWP